MRPINAAEVVRGITEFGYRLYQASAGAGENVHSATATPVFIGHVADPPRKS